MFPPDLPPISNKALYAYRVFAKWLSFFIFGLSSFILGIIVLPVMRLVLHPRKRFQKHGRRFISCALRFFIFIMHSMRIVDLEADNRENYRNLSSKIIVANHPSLLDVVMLFSLIPNADCIVSAYLKQGILTGVVCQLYIVNSPDLDKILQLCTASLKQGNCLIIFPEGTRTPRTGKPILKKGAARIALTSGCNIVPVHIGGTDKFGLGKKDPWPGFNPRERYIYRLSMGAEIDPEKYRNLPASAAARIMTNEISASLFPAKQESQEHLYKSETIK
jgi:1-acyl-sn-glycerol-3-phosphate acyltransferase